MVFTEEDKSNNLKVHHEYWCKEALFILLIYVTRLADGCKQNKKAFMAMYYAFLKSGCLVVGYSYK